jgi:trimethylamine--corrinoid protein Co-methyltransferase
VERTKQNLIHDASLELLSNTGVAFHTEDAIRLFRSRGFKTDQNIVFFNEAQIQTALRAAPAEFTVRAREPEYSLALGGHNAPALAPGYGAPFIMRSDGSRRKATIADYQSFCKLVQTSSTINFNGFMMGDPSDLSADTYHLDMLLNSITLCSKPFMGSPLSPQAAQDSVRMARIVFGNSLKPVMVSNINSLAPLQFSFEMAQSILIFAEAGQPVIITGGGIMGSTVPIRLAGLITIQNAAVLAGLTLAQLVNPGTPVLYGAAGSPLDMQTGAYYQGGPETNQAISAGVSMAIYYGLPSRGGGSMTDSHTLNYQAGYQSALALNAAIASGVSFVLHACGILGAYMTMSFEKFLADEELCRHLLKTIQPFEISDEAIDLSLIREVGVGGQFLTHRSTFERCRSEFLSLPLANRLPFDQWQTRPDKSYQAKAKSALTARLSEYQKPNIDPAMEKELMKYVETRKEGPT